MNPDPTGKGSPCVVVLWGCRIVLFMAKGLLLVSPH